MVDPDPLQPASISDHEMLDERALLDWEAVLQLTEGDAGVLRELIELFHDQLPQLLDDIRAAIAAEDPEALRRAAHTLMGSTAVFHSERATEAALVLETAAKERKLALVQPMYAQLERETRLLAAAL